MKTLVDQLAKYATYHRDRRNIATHLVGIPMFVVAEVGFAMGMRAEVEHQTEERAGPVRSLKPQSA